MALVWILASLEMGMAPYWRATPYPWAWGFIPKEQGIAMLEDQARMLESELEGIRKRLEELKKQEQK